MRHCTADDLMDVVDGARDEASLPHLAVCAPCADALRELRQTLAAVRHVPVPEPSPLFWDHLSAKVREAVAAGPYPSNGGWWTRWRVVLPAAGAAAALVLAAYAVPHLGQRDDAPEIRAESPAGPPLPAETTAALDDDPSIGFMLDLVDGLDLDTVANAGLTASADAAFDELSADERRELERLLKEAMGSPGA
jgi:hypothetical protein